MQPSDRRRDVRTHVSLSAELVRVGSAEKIEVVNASFRGVFARVTLGIAPPQLNELVKLDISLPDRKIRLHAVGVRFVPEPNGKMGIGFRFFALNGEDKRAWESYIAQLLAPRRAAA